MKLSNLKVLTIDDSPMIQTIVKNILISFDVDQSQIYQAPDGEKGLEVVAERPLDIILCDLSMEPMDGFEFVRRLREHDDKRVRNLPVIILTVHGEEKFVAKAKRIEIDGYLLKPIAPKTLKQRVISVLQRHNISVET